MESARKVGGGMLCGFDFVPQGISRVSSSSTISLSQNSVRKNSKIIKCRVVGVCERLELGRSAARNWVDQGSGWVESVTCARACSTSETARKFNGGASQHMRFYSRGTSLGENRLARRPNPSASPDVRASFAASLNENSLVDRDWDEVEATSRAEKGSAAEDETLIPEVLMADPRTVGLVSEMSLSGDADAQMQDLSGARKYSLRSIKELIRKLGVSGKEFSLSSVKQLLNMGKKTDKAHGPAFGAAMYETKQGVSTVAQWTATELTMQRAALVRIATDILVFAFSFFGLVRICEAVVAALATSPPQYRELMQATNAMDPLTVAWLAYNLRKPILGMLQVDPVHLEEVTTLKEKLWEELHTFFERQWKVMATIAMARSLSIIATRVPAAELITKNVKLAWDMLMALPIF